MFDVGWFFAYKSWKNSLSYPPLGWLLFQALVLSTRRVACWPSLLTVRSVPKIEDGSAWREFVPQTSENWVFFAFVK